MKKDDLIIIGIIILFAYVLRKVAHKSESESVIASGGMPLPNQQSDEHYTDTLNPRTPATTECINPSFNENVDISGRMCAGTLINENKVLRLGDQGCEVLLLQQRLNSMKNQSNILKPSGKFCCKTRSKLLSVMGVESYALNQFNQDEQTGFNELKGGTKVMPYSYMDLNTYKK
jgi:hypothetical protein